MATYLTEGELRTFLQFSADDYPTADDMEFFIRIASMKVDLDIDSDSENVLLIATLYLAKSYVLRGLATKAVSKGYIQFNAEGRTVTKAYQELVLAAENVYQEYKEFILSVGRREATSTQFLDDTTDIDALTRQDVLDIMNGRSDVVDLQAQYRHNSFWSRRNT